jgi:putative ABC transport system ATP-binding protein
MSLPAASTPPANVQVVDLAKRYGTGADATTVFEQVNLEVAAGEFVAIVGDSGVGKSTLLNCLAGLDRWDQGQVLHQGQDIGRLDEAGLAVWRRAHVGFVFQAFHVLPHLSVAQNVALPLMLLARGTPAEQDARVQAMLAAVGLGDRGSACPSSSAAASCSGWPLPAPWCTARPCCWPTSPPAISTRTRPPAPWTCWWPRPAKPAPAWCWSPIPRTLRPAPTGCCG